MGDPFGIGKGYKNNHDVKYHGNDMRHGIYYALSDKDLYKEYSDKLKIGFISIFDSTNINVINRLTKKLYLEIML